MPDCKNISLKEFRNSIQKNKTLVGLDLGDKTIGIAVSDTLWMIASPLKTVFRSSFVNDMNEIRNLLKGRELTGFVAGLPLLMDGNEGNRAEITRNLGHRIAEHFDLPIYFQDERLSSRAVERILIKDLDLSRKKQKKAIDSNAAAFILQGALDQLQFSSLSSSDVIYTKQTEK